MNENNQNGKNKLELTKKDVFKVWNAWYWQPEISNSFERMQALSFCVALTPALKKLYPKKEDYCAALKRHLQFFNCEGIFGSIIHGITLSLEEEKANGEPIDDSLISGLKTGLMGPMAGIGDTLNWATLKPLFYSLGVTFAINGNALGVVFPFLFALTTYCIGYNVMSYGYRLGKEAITTMLNNGIINKVIMASSILGLFMMGALSASYIKLQTVLQFTLPNSDKVLKLQEIIDSICPGMLPLILVMGIYIYFRKKEQNYNKVLIVILVGSLLGAFLGIF